MNTCYTLNLAAAWISWSYALPALIFLAVAGLWYAAVQSGGRIRRSLSVAPVMCCYLVAAILLLSGGCHRIAHVKLEGVEVDLQSRSGKVRALVIGGADDEQAPAIRVPGYPADALRLRLLGKKLLLAPGPGYRRDILVRNGGRLMSLEKEGTPKLVPLEDGDRITVSDQAGGGGKVEWTLGAGKYDLTPSGGKARWLGGSSKGVARAPGYPAEVLSVSKVSTGIKLERGPGLGGGIRVLVDGRQLRFGDKKSVVIRYRPGKTRLALVRRDPLAGEITWRSSGLFGKQATLDAKAKPRAYSIDVSPKRSVTLGGGVGDAIYVKGMPTEAYRLTVENGQLVLQQTSEGGVKHIGAAVGWQHRVGEEHSPAGGVLSISKVIRDGNENESEGSEESGGPSPAVRIECVWTPNAHTRWQLPNRVVTVPVVGWEVPVFVRHQWDLKVYPLASLAGRESGMRSCIVYGAGELGKYQAGLLVMDPGVAVERNGVKIESKITPMVVDTGKGLEFLQLISVVQQGLSSAVRGSAQAGEIRDLKNVRLRRQTGMVSVKVRENEQGKKIPYLEMRYTKPVIRDIPLDDLEADVEENEALEGRVAFGVNERSEFASLPHQVRFRSLTGWFNKANGEVEIRDSKLRVQDDYARKVVDFDESFTVGGSDRLMLRMEKRTIPWGVIGKVGIAAVLALVAAWKWCGNFAGMALFFGVAFLTCSRVLFGQAVMVNAPYDPSVLHQSTTVMMALPVVLSILAWGSVFVARRGVPTILSRVGSWCMSRKYWQLSLVVLALLLLRIVLVLAGIKEGLPLGGMRLALSIVFVPAWLLLFSAGMVRLRKCLLDRDRSENISRDRWAHLCYNGWLFLCQALTGMAVSDIGVFVFLIPQALVLAVTSVWYLLADLRAKRLQKAFSARRWWNVATSVVCMLGLILPMLLILTFCFKPQHLVGNISKFNDPLMNREEIPTDSTALRVLQFLDKDYLINLGTDAAEEIAQDHAIMENYAHRGMLGQGYLQVDVISAKRVTALNDNVSAVYIFGQFGVLGACAVLIAYLAIGMSGLIRNNGRLSGWAGAMAALTFAITSTYMLAANWGITPFTGRNMYLLGLNSLGDVLESSVLLGLIVLAWGMSISGKSRVKTGKNSSAVLDDGDDTREGQGG